MSNEKMLDKAQLEWLHHTIPKVEEYNEPYINYGTAWKAVKGFYREYFRDLRAVSALEEFLLYNYSTHKYGKVPLFSDLVSGEELLDKRNLPFRKLAPAKPDKSHLKNDHFYAFQTEAALAIIFLAFKEYTESPQKYIAKFKGKTRYDQAPKHLVSIYLSHFTALSVDLIEAANNMDGLLTQEEYRRIFDVFARFLLITAAESLAFCPYHENDITMSKDLAVALKKLAEKCNFSDLEKIELTNLNALTEAFIQRETKVEPFIILLMFLVMLAIVFPTLAIALNPFFAIGAFLALVGVYLIYKIDKAHAAKAFSLLDTVTSKLDLPQETVAMVSSILKKNGNFSLEQQEETKESKQEVGTHEDLSLDTLKGTEKVSATTSAGFFHIVDKRSEKVVTLSEGGKLDDTRENPKDL